jgi:hypothetical protein
VATLGDPEVRKFLIHGTRPGVQHEQPDGEGPRPGPRSAGQPVRRSHYLVRTATAIAARYMGAERAGESGQRNGVPGELVVRLRPVRVLANFDITG